MALFLGLYSLGLCLRMLNLAQLFSRISADIGVQNPLISPFWRFTESTRTHFSFLFNIMIWLHHFSLPFPPFKPFHIPCLALFQIHTLILKIVKCICVYVETFIFLNTACSICMSLLVYELLELTIWYWISVPFHWEDYFSRSQPSFIVYGSSWRVEASWTFPHPLLSICCCPGSAPV